MRQNGTHETDSVSHSEERGFHEAKIAITPHKADSDGRTRGLREEGLKGDQGRRNRTKDRRRGCLCRIAMRAAKKRERGEQETEGSRRKFRSRKWGKQEKGSP